MEALFKGIFDRSCHYDRLEAIHHRNHHSMNFLNDLTWHKLTREELAKMPVEVFHIPGVSFLHIAKEGVTYMAIMEDARARVKAVLAEKVPEVAGRV